MLHYRHSRKLLNTHTDCQKLVRFSNFKNIGGSLAFS